MINNVKKLLLLHQSVWASMALRKGLTARVNGFQVAKCSIHCGIAFNGTKAVLVKNIGILNIWINADNASWLSVLNAIKHDKRL